MKGKVLISFIMDGNKTIITRGNEVGDDVGGDVSAKHLIVWKHYFTATDLRIKLMLVVIIKVKTISL